MFDISHSFLFDPLNEIVYQEYLALLPQAMRDKILKYRRWQDAHLSLMGKILLLEHLKKKGIENTILEKIEYNTFGRPSLPNLQFDFNIAHSGNLVVCAVADCRIGVDIEKIEPINLNDFRRFLTEQEWQDINDSHIPLMSFYNIWTQKEATLKAIGKGLNIPLSDIILKENKAFYRDQIWSLKQIVLSPDYCLSVAFFEEKKNEEKE